MKQTIKLPYGEYGGTVRQSPPEGYCEIQADIEGALAVHRYFVWQSVERRQVIKDQFAISHLPTGGSIGAGADTLLFQTAQQAKAFRRILEPMAHWEGITPAWLKRQDHRDEMRRLYKKIKAAYSDFIRKQRAAKGAITQ